MDEVPWLLQYGNTDAATKTAKTAFLVTNGAYLWAAVDLFHHQQPLFATLIFGSFTASSFFHGTQVCCPERETIHVETTLVGGFSLNYFEVHARGFEVATFWGSDTLACMLSQVDTSCKPEIVQKFLMMDYVCALASLGAACKCSWELGLDGIPSIDWFVAPAAIASLIGSVKVSASLQAPLI